jgi:hypothetical protein
VPKLRYQPPDRLPGAANFSGSDDLRGSLNAVKLVRANAWVWDGLRQACAGLESNYARHREAGCWELAAVAFVTSRQIDLQPWWDETTDELWRECGFNGKPPYMRAYRRLRELEKVCDEFLAAAALVIQRCKAHDSRVMAHVHFDFTEDETHAALVHDCQPGENCKHAVVGTRHGKRRAAPGQALHPTRVSTAVAREQREDWNTKDPAETAKAEKAAAPTDIRTDQRGSRKVTRIRLGGANGCWYRTRDAEAGTREYGGPRGSRRFWHGYYSGKAVDHFTGGVIPTVDAANKQEYHLFPAFYDRVTTMAGAAPETVIGDKGFSVASCFQHATENGSAPVFPWRKGRAAKRHDELTHDRHGVPRCKHCGGPTEQVRFSANNGKPRIWVRCIPQYSTDCAGEQTISCSTDWRLLVPLPRTEALYHELKESHQTYEAAHDYWRDRYKVGADDIGIRPKIVGLGWHRLRANVACLIDWLRIAAKNNWLGSAVSGFAAAGERKFKSMGESIARKLGKIRVAAGLASPYGPQAKKLRLGPASPPSAQPRGAPPPPILPASP